MSCQHGNWPPCDQCAEIEAAYDRGFAAGKSAAADALPGDGVDWRAMYRFQTAMRYMDAMKMLTRERAYEMADDDIRGLIAAAPQPETGLEPGRVSP